MSAGGRGPTGAAPLPPTWLPTAALPIVELAGGSSLVRVHRVDLGPVFYSPGAGKAPVGRFDSPSGRFGVLYVAQAFAGAFAETVLRNPRRRLVDLAEITGRAVTVLGLSRPVRLVEMRGAGLQALGTDNAVSTGPYGPCGAWADALFAHPDEPDGIAYASRHDPDQVCVALFSRPDLALDVLSGPTPLSGMLDDVAALLRRYAKGLG
jgi:hypothetical protein